MTNPGVIEHKEVANSNTTTGNGWIVIVYDNDKNTFDEVVDILMRATACGLEEAQIETWEVDKLGKSVVHKAGEAECRRTASVISEIGIRVEVTEE